MAFWTKRHTLDFIELYRKKECLWKVKSKDYNNKLKRERAYDDLVSFVQTFYDDANKDTVTCKISNLRNAWRKQHKKMTSSIGTADGETYEPSLFYFDHLKFICDSVIPKKSGNLKIFSNSNSNGDNAFQVITKEEYFQDASTDVDSPEENAFYQEEQQSVDDEPPLDMSVRSVTPTPVPEETEKRTEQQAPRGRKRSLEDDLLYLVCQKLVSGHEKGQKDDFATFGETVANDLRTMSREQFIHAKKLISDVLYEGTLNNLSRSSSLVTVSETLSPRPRQNTDSVEDIPNTSAATSEEHCSNSHDQ